MSLEVLLMRGSKGRFLGPTSFRGGSYFLRETTPGLSRHGGGSIIARRSIRHNPVMATAAARFVQHPTDKGCPMARATISDPKRHTACEPLYDIDPQTGASVEIFYADSALAASFSTPAGWFWWACQPGLLPGGLPIGPFDTSYAAYRNFATRSTTRQLPSPPGLKSSIEYFAMSVGIGRTLVAAPE